MKIALKCFSTLANANACDFNNSRDYHLAEGQTVADLARHAGIGSENIKIAFVNNRSVSLDTVLTNGDRVGLAPVTGGM